jgi:hypothetical protein
LDFEFALESPMFSPFFKIAAVSPERQWAFRTLVVFHVLSAAAGAAFVIHKPALVPVLGPILLVAGIIEGALVLGWRLTQLPKTQALEFLLVSPLRPRRLLVADATVGLCRLAFVTLAGLPVLLYLVLEGLLLPEDLVPLLVMPFTWGALTGLALVTWAYEHVWLRRWGERVLLLLVLVYLVVGVLAAENLQAWLAGLPDGWDRTAVEAFRTLHAYSPFTVLHDALSQPPEESWPRLVIVELLAVGVTVGLLARSACRLQDHFRDRHYLPVQDVSRRRRPAVGSRPLSWWAVKRVSEFSGRVNLWLAGGFALLYGAYTVAGNTWPPYLGRHVFLIFDEFGGVPAVATALVVLAAVPAAFQYGLWDSNTQDRCRRLELLLLTDLGPEDYWHAATAAAWRRGRGYFLVAVLLWVCLVLSGRAGLGQVLVAAASGVVLWGLYFALGFRAFARGQQANRLGLTLTVGLPLLACWLYWSDLAVLGALVPAGGVYLPTTDSPASTWLPGPTMAALTTLLVGRRTLRHCDADLRRWYDRHHGRKN